MTTEQERAANELVAYLTDAVKYPGVAAREEVRKPAGEAGRQVGQAGRRAAQE